MTYRGHVQGGVIVYDPSIPLAEGAEVRYEYVVEPDEPASDEENPLLKMLELVSDTGIPDLATNIDHYLYGHPKVDDEK